MANRLSYAEDPYQPRGNKSRASGVGHGEQAAPPSQSPQNRFIMRGEKPHKPIRICVIIAASLFYCGNITVSTLSSFPYFNNKTIAIVSDAKEILLTPAKKTFAIWGVVYFLLAVLHLYSIANIFRSDDINYKYQVNGLVSNTTLILLSISYVLCSAWVFLFLYEDKFPTKDYSMLYQAICLVTLTLINFGALCSAQVTNISACNTKQFNKASKRENALYQIFVVNSIALYFGWTLIAANLSVGMAVDQYFKPEAKTLGFNMCLSLSICISLYLFVDTVWLKYSAYTVLAYASFVVGAVGIYFNGNDSKDPPKAGDVQQPTDFPLKQFIKIILSWILVFAAAKVIICISSSIKYFRKSR